MNQTTLRVRLEADVKNLQKNLRNAERDVDEFGNKLNSQDRKLNKFGKGNDGATKSLKGLSKETNVNAVPAMTSFSQVIQDAPYGIQGVANNITQLTSQMGYLSKSAGGVGGALKSLASSLVGPAGILLAISVITSLLVSYGDKLSFAASKTKELAKATAEHISQAKTEISTLKQLVEIANDHSQSIITRRNAIKQINDKYGDYLGNLDLEKIKTDKVTSAIDRLTLSLIHQAKIKGLEDLITDKTAGSAEELLDLELRKRDAFKAVQKELKKLQGTDYFRTVIKDSNTVQENLDAVSKSTKGVDHAQLRLLKSSVAAYKGLKNEISEVQAETDKALNPLLSMQKDLRAKDLGFSLTPEFDQDDVVIKGSGKGLKVPVTLDPHNVDILDMEDDTAEMTAFVDNFLDEDAKLREKIGEAQYEFRLNEALSAEAEAYKTTLEELSAHSDEMGAIIEGGLGNAIGNITNDLMEGSLTLKGFGDIITSSLSQIAGALMKNFIIEKIFGKAKQGIEFGKSQANAITIASSAAASMGPLGIGALSPLIASTMGTIGGAFAGIQAFADGGIVQGGSYSGDKVLARLNSGELVLNKMQQKQMGAMMTPTMMMNNQPMEIFGETRIEGDAIVVAYKRSQAKNNRYS